MTTLNNAWEEFNKMIPSQYDEAVRQEIRDVYYFGARAILMLIDQLATSVCEEKITFEESRYLTLKLANEINRYFEDQPEQTKHH